MNHSHLVNGAILKDKSFVYFIGPYFLPELSLPTLNSFLLWQAGGRAGEAAEQQQIGRYHSVFYTLLEYNLALGTQWYSPVTLRLLCLFPLVFF